MADNTSQRSSDESPDEMLNRAGPDLKLVEERRAKLSALREAGNAFPNDFRRSDLAADLHRQYRESSGETLEAEHRLVSVAGRMVLKRIMGKASFASIQDMSGRIQLYIANDVAGAEAHAAFKHYDLGDILGAEGSLFRTRDGRTVGACNQFAPADEVPAAPS